METLNQTARRYRSGLSICVLPFLVGIVGCNHDPEKTVTVEIIGISSDSDREQVRALLLDMTDARPRLVTTTFINDNMTAKVSPVADVQAFVRRIEFGRVAEVQGRTVKVEFRR